MVWFSIREFTLNDADFAFRITDIEGWGYSKNDFTSMLESGLGDHFIAEELDGERRIGMISTYNYGGKLGWIGNVIVSKEYRQRGVATSLVEYAMKHLRTAGIGTIRLYSYSHSEHLYEKLGFAKEGVIGVFSATPSEDWSKTKTKTESNKGNLMTADEVNLQKLLRLDAKCFGADRGRILTSMIQDKNTACFIQVRPTNRDKIIGYVVASGSEAECDIGPMVCDPKQGEVAKSLIEAAMKHIKAKKFSLASSIGNPASARILRSLGFKKTIQVQKMRKGRNLYKGKTSWIFGVGGLEKG